MSMIFLRVLILGDQPGSDRVLNERLGPAVAPRSRRKATARPEQPDRAEPREHNLTPRFDPTGWPVSILGVARDITERPQARHRDHCQDFFANPQARPAPQVQRDRLFRSPSIATSAIWILPQ